MRILDWFKASLPLLPHKDEVWFLRASSDPWGGKSPSAGVTILDVRQGWVRYKLNGGSSTSLFQDERMRTMMFISIYYRKRLPRMNDILEALKALVAIADSVGDLANTSLMDAEIATARAVITKHESALNIHHNQPMRMLKLTFASAHADPVTDMLRRKYLFSWNVVIESNQAEESGSDIWAIILFADERIANALIEDIRSIVDGS